MDDRHYRQGSGRRPKSIRRVRAFTLIEVLIAAFILVLMAMMVAAVVPIATRGSHMSRSYSQAILLAQRKIDQLQDKGFSQLQGTTIPSTIADNGGVSTGTYTEGTMTFQTYPFTTESQLTTILGPGATGTTYIRHYGGAGIAGNDSLLGVRVVITWRDRDNGAQSKYVLATLITKMPMNN